MKWAAIIIAGLVLLCLACLSLVVVAVIAWQLYGTRLELGPLPASLAGSPNVSETTVPFESIEIDEMAGD
ncbi:MAG: hypothetical protein PVH03_13540, partial [Chloroflexota bacterium]